MSLLSCISRSIRHHAGRCRLMSTEISKDSIMSVRRQTGVGLSKCRAALLKYNGDVAAASAHLKEEAVKHGWARMEKLSSRASCQGLLGAIQSDDNKAISFVEVTCETDFVQRNDKFVDLVHNLTQAFHQNSQSLLPVGSSMAVGKYGFDTLRDMKLVNGTSNVGDYLASCVGILGENVVLRRGIVITSPLLASYVHAIFAPARGTCQFGHIGVITDLQMTSADSSYDEKAKVASRHVCQHLLSMDSPNAGLDLVARPYDLEKLQEVHKATFAEGSILDESRNLGQVLADGGLQMGGFLRVQLGDDTTDGA